MDKDLVAVIVRSTTASPYFGYLVSKTDDEVVLTKARRIWRWYGAMTLSEVASFGVDISRSKIAAPVDVTISKWNEIINCSPIAITNLEGAKWAV